MTGSDPHCPPAPGRHGRRPLAVIPALALLLAAAWASAADPGPVPAPVPPPVRIPGLEFIDTGIENGSPVWYDASEDGAIRLHLLYDHERASPNRAAGHVHVRVHGTPGARLTFEFLNLDNVWNGQPGSVARELKAVVVSDDGRHWRSVPTTSLPGNRVRLTVELSGPRLDIARVEPYRLSDLDAFLQSLRGRPGVRLATLGRTVQGRPLELLHVGRARAPHRVFVRARAHPWESGGNWVVEGLVRRLLQDDPEARRFRRSYSLAVLPMANKDGVANGRTRFNARGMDLNRNWDRPADPELAPENAALERWLEAEIQAGRRPDLALELHNDGNGQLHISRPQVPDLDRYLSRMTILEDLLRRHTWFTEGSTRASFRNPGTLGDGWLERFGIDAVVHEFNANWNAGLNEAPSARHWLDYGARLATVLAAYFEDRDP